MRQGRRYFWGTMFAAIAVGVLGAAPATASRAGCRAKAGEGAERVAASDQAIVLRKRNGSYHGCAFNSDPPRLRKLQGQTDDTTLLEKTVQVQGRSAAYATKYDLGDRTIKVYSRRLDTGRSYKSANKVFTDPDVGGDAGDCNKEQAHGDNVRLGQRIVLRKNGSVAWAFSYHYRLEDRWTRIFALDQDGAHVFDCDERGEDRDNLIDPDSLELFDGNGATGRVTWSRQDGDGHATTVEQAELR